MSGGHLATTVGVDPGSLAAGKLAVDESGGRPGGEDGETLTRLGRSRFRSDDVDRADVAPGLRDDARDQSGEPEL